MKRLQVDPTAVVPVRSLTYLITTPVTSQYFILPLIDNLIESPMGHLKKCVDSQRVDIKTPDGFSRLNDKEQHNSRPLVLFFPLPKRYILEKYWAAALGVISFVQDGQIKVLKQRRPDEPYLSLSEYLAVNQVTDHLINPMFNQILDIVLDEETNREILSIDIQEKLVCNWLDEQYFVGALDIPRISADLLCHRIGCDLSKGLISTEQYLAQQKEITRDISILRQQGFITGEDDAWIDQNVQIDRRLYQHINEVLHRHYALMVEGMRRGLPKKHQDRPDQIKHDPPVTRQWISFFHLAVLRGIRIVKRILRSLYVILFPPWSDRTHRFERLWDRLISQSIIKFIFKNLARLLLWIVSKLPGHGKFIKHCLGKMFPEGTGRHRLFHKLNQRLFPDDFSAEYRLWFTRHKVGCNELTIQSEISKCFEYQPLISLITPVYNPELHHIEELVDSVLAQTYPQWELCLANASSDPSMNAKLAGYARLDQRIKHRQIEQNMGISGNSNIAIEMASGEFLFIVDHDDRIEPDTLFEIVQCLNAKPGTDVLYFDEDKLDLENKLCEPWFKPGHFNEMMLFSANYLMHSVFRKSLVVELGCFRSRFDGAQDWDLALRLVRKTNRIEHISKGLYHWRMTYESCAYRADAKPYAKAAQMACLSEQLTERGLSNVQVSITPEGYVRLNWDVKEKFVSIIIPTKDNLSMLKHCLEGILGKTNHPMYEIILVDSKSTKKNTFDYYESIQGSDKIHVVQLDDTPFNYSRSINAGVAAAKGEVVLLLNNDIQPVSADWLKELLKWLEIPQVGVVGAKLLYPDHHIQHAGVIMGMSGHANHIFYGMAENTGSKYGSPNWYRNYIGLTGACQLIRKSDFLAVGGYDEQYQLVLGDIAFCLKMVEKGFINVYDPFAQLYHYESVSRGKGKLAPVTDIEFGYFEFKDFITNGDPYYNDQLSYSQPVPSLRKEGEMARQELMQNIFDQYNINWRVS